MAANLKVGNPRLQKSGVEGTGLMITCSQIQVEATRGERKTSREQRAEDRNSINVHEGRKNKSGQGRKNLRENKKNPGNEE